VSLCDQERCTRESETEKIMQSKQNDSLKDENKQEAKLRKMNSTRRTRTPRKRKIQREKRTKKNGTV